MSARSNISVQHFLASNIFIALILLTTTPQQLPQGPQ